MDQAARWRTGTGGQKGPFTVDSGGGGVGTGGSSPVTTGRSSNKGNVGGGGGAGITNGIVAGGSASASSLSSMRGAAMSLVGGSSAGNEGGQGGVSTTIGGALPRNTGLSGQGQQVKDPRANVSRQSSLSSTSSRMDNITRGQPGPSAPYQRPAPPTSRHGHSNSSSTLSTAAQSFSHRQLTPAQSPNMGHNVASPTFAVPNAGPISASSSRAQTPAPQMDMQGMQQHQQRYSSSPSQTQGGFGNSNGYQQAMGGSTSSIPSMNINHGSGQAHRRQKTTGHAHPYSRSGSSTPLDPPPSPFGYDGFPLSSSANLQQSHFPSSFTPTASGWANGLPTQPGLAFPASVGGASEEVDWNAFQAFAHGQAGNQQHSGLSGSYGQQHYQQPNGNAAQQQFFAAVSASMPNHSGTDALSALSPAELTQLLSGLAREELSSESGNGGTGAQSFLSNDQSALLGSYSASQAGFRPQATPQRPITAQVPIGHAATQGPSLLSRRMQQYRVDDIPSGNEGGNESVMAQSSMSSGSGGSMGILPTPPASFSSTFAYPPGRHNSRPAAGWGPDRGIGSPNQANFSGVRQDQGSIASSQESAQRQQAIPHNASAPQRPAPVRTTSSSSRPPSAPASPHGPKRLSAMTPQSPYPPHEVASGAMQTPNTNQVDLPPLPPGIDIEQLAQYGAAGLEMAIRMGMGIGMGLGQASAGQGGKTPEVNSPLIQQQLAALLNEVASSPNGTLSTSPFSGSASGQRNTPQLSGDGFKPDIVSDILGEDFFTHRNPSTPGATPGLSSYGPSIPPSRRPSQSGDTGIMSPTATSPNPVVYDSEPPAELVKRDPLAAQVWKAYAKSRGGLPSGPRMENLTWRLMHMTLKKPDGTKFPPPPGMAMEAVAEEEADGSAPAVNDALRETDPAGEGDRGRGRSKKGKGKVVGFQAESPQGHEQSDPDAMDWRAASRSRSRVSVMDWRPQSRSRSRSAFGRKAYDYANEAHSHALLAQNGGLWPESEDLLQNGLTQTFPGDNGEWHLSQIMASMQESGVLDTPGGTVDREIPVDASDEDFLAGIASYLPQFADMQQQAPPPPRGQPSQLTYDRAVKAAALAYDEDQAGAVSPEAPARRSSNYPTLPGISGPGLVDRSEENYHPQYGYLPRRVRKTSFDHTVGQEEGEAGLLPPPMSSRCRKRPAEGSPHIQTMSHPAPPSLELPTAEALHAVPGSFPNTAFTFAVPQSTYDNFFDINAASSSTPVPTTSAPLPPTTGTSNSDNNEGLDTGSDEAQAWLNNLQNALANEAPDYYQNGQTESSSLANSPPMMTELQAAILNGHAQVGDAYQFQQMMQSYLQPDMLANPFMTINPTDVLGANGSNNNNHPSYASPPEVPPPTVGPSTHMPPPTRPLPKSVGGKAVVSKGESRRPSTGPGNPSGPHRSNSSPNLAGLKLTSAQPAPSTSGGKAGAGHHKSASVSAKSASKAVQAQASQGAPSGETTPTSEDGGPGSIIVGGDASVSCTNCKTKNTPLWRRDPDGQPLCNACGLFYKLHGVVRPLSLKTDVIKKRNRAQPAKDGATAPSRKNSVSTGKGSSGAKSKASSPVASGASGSVGAIGIPPRKIRRGGSEGMSIPASPVSDHLAQFSTSAGSLSMTSLTNGR